ncbi:MAG: hypothetical protein ACOX1Z_02155 [Candidatus Ratteibacteria bacterium]
MQAICPKRKTSIPNKEHKIFPYLLREMRIEYPNQVMGNGHNLYQNASGAGCIWWQLWTGTAGMS